MPRPDLTFDSRNLPAATSNSRRSSHALLRDVVEPPAVTVERGLLTGQLLPTPDDDIDILGIKFQPVADTLGQFGSGERSTGTQERVIHEFATPEMVQDRAPHQLDGLLRGVIVFVLVRAAHNELGRRRIPDRGVLAGFAEPGCVLLPDIPAGLVLEPVVRARKDGSTFVPNDLLVVKKSDTQQAVQNLAREFAGVPDVGHIETRNEREGIGPVSAGVAGDRSLGVTGGSLFHIAGLGRPAAV